MELKLFEVTEDYDLFKHDVYDRILNFNHLEDWMELDHDECVGTINQLLMPYNGIVSVWKWDLFILKFKTESDLTQFVLTWS